MKRSIPLLLALAAAGAQAAPLPAGLPIAGIWQLDVPEAGCTETYRIQADGTALVTSGAEVAETTLDIAAQPDANGFHRAEHRIVKDNGKADCSGHVTKPGHVIQTFIQLHPSGNLFLMCGTPDRRACVPLVRVKGDWI